MQTLKNKVLYGNTARVLSKEADTDFRSQYIYRSFAVRTNIDEDTHYNSDLEVGTVKDLRKTFKSVIDPTPNEARVLKQNLDRLELNADEKIRFAVSTTGTGYEVMILRNARWKKYRDEDGTWTQINFKADFIVLDFDTATGKETKISVFKESIDRFHSMRKKMTHRLKMDRVQNRGGDRKSKKVSNEAIKQIETEFSPEQAKPLIEHIAVTNNNADDFDALKARCAIVESILLDKFGIDVDEIMRQSDDDFYSDN